MDAHGTWPNGPPLALDAAESEVVEPTSGNNSLEEHVGLVFLRRSLRVSKFGAITLASIPPGLSNAGYPEDLWWMGLYARASSTGQWADSLEAMLPTPFSA